MSKFSSKRDEVLSGLCLEGWANRSDGDSSGYGVWFARISNDVQDVAVNNPEFVSLFESFDFGFALDAELSASLVGHFVVTESIIGTVTVVEFASQFSATVAYEEYSSDYALWLRS